MGAGLEKMNLLDRLEFRDNNRHDMLEHKIKVLHSTAWHDKWQWESDQYTKWLGNFKPNERINAMFMLSKFMYFGNETIRELMVRVYEDLYKRPIVYAIRRNNENTKDSYFIEAEFKKILDRTRFLSLGNPSESSAHLLYYFRQENRLKRDMFISPHEIFIHDASGEQITARITLDGIDRIVILDDFCGSGNQASKFHDEFVRFIKEKNKDINIAYYALFAIEEGLGKVRALSFDDVESIFILDESYKCFSDRSRFFEGEKTDFKMQCKTISEEYGKRLSQIPLGYKDCQMLLGFHHNTPNNTLPIFWYEGDGWEPIFKRFAKRY